MSKRRQTKSSTKQIDRPARRREHPSEAPLPDTARRRGGTTSRVAPPGTFPEVKVLETNASKAGVQYTAAGGHKIDNLGMQRPYIFLQDGSMHIMSFQVAGVSKALGAVSRLVGAGNRVIFDDPATVGSFIENKATGKKTPLRQHNGVYYLDVGKARLRIR